MIDSWIDCPHCGTNVTATLDTCTHCGGDLKHLSDGSPNPGQINEGVKAFQVVGFFEKWWVAILIALAALGLLSALF